MFFNIAKQTEIYLYSHHLGVETGGELKARKSYKFKSLS